MKAAKIFNEVLQFTEVSTFTDLKRKSIIRKLQNLKRRSAHFTEKEENKKAWFDQNSEEPLQKCKEEFEKMIKESHPDLKGERDWETKELTQQQAFRLANKLQR